MSVAVARIFAVAKIAAIVAVLLIAVGLLPDAPDELEELVIPDVIFNPLTAVLQLDRYFPIATLLAIAGVSISIRVGMAGLWVYSWISRHIFGGG